MVENALPVLRNDEERTIVRALSDPAARKKRFEQVIKALHTDLTNDTFLSPRKNSKLLIYLVKETQH